MTVSLTLAVIGTDEEPRWATDVRSGGGSAPKWSYCCEEGHFTPESAASHGAEVGAARMAREVRRLAPGTCGALTIQKLEPVAG